MDLLKLILQNAKDIKKLERQLCCSGNNISGNIFALQFRVGDGGFYTPTNGSSVFSPASNPLISKQIISIFAGNLWVPPTSLANTSELSWSFNSSTGVITLSNGTFNTDTIYSILYQ